MSQLRQVDDVPAALCRTYYNQVGARSAHRGRLPGAAAMTALEKRLRYRLELTHSVQVVTSSHTVVRR